MSFTPLIIIDIVLALISLIIQYRILKRIKYNYNTCLDKINNSTTSSEEDTLYIELKRLFANKSTVSDVKTAIQDYYGEEIDTIQIEANLAPTWGLFFSFIGILMIVLGYVVSKEQTIENLGQILFGLIPLGIGSAAGIYIYRTGYVSIKNLQFGIRKAVTNWLNIYDNEISLLDKLPLDEVYTKLFKPISLLLENFKKLDTQFSNFGTRLVESSESIPKSLKECSGTIQSNNTRILESVTAIKQFSSSLNVIQDGLVSSADQFQKFIATTGSLSNIMKTLGEATGIVCASCFKLDTLVQKIEDQNKSNINLTSAYERYTLTAQGVDKCLGAVTNELEKFGIKLVEITNKINKASIPSQPVQPLRQIQVEEYKPKVKESTIQSSHQPPNSDFSSSIVNDMSNKLNTISTQLNQVIHASKSQGSLNREIYDLLGEDIINDLNNSKNQDNVKSIWRKLLFWRHE